MQGTAYTFFTTDNARSARELVTLLKDAGTEPPPALEEMAMIGGGGGGGRCMFTFVFTSMKFD